MLCCTPSRGSDIYSNILKEPGTLGTQATPPKSGRYLPSVIIFTPTKPKERSGIPIAMGTDATGNRHPSLVSSEFESSSPSSIPETQIPVFRDPTPSPTTPSVRNSQAKLQPPTGSPMRRNVEMVWKPSGHRLTIDLLHIPFLGFRQMLKEIQQMVGPKELNPDEQGVHYSIDGSKESILTMSDEFDVFKERLARTKADARITLRPVAPRVSCQLPPALSWLRFVC